MTPLRTNVPDRPARSPARALRTLRAFAVVFGGGWGVAALVASSPAADPALADVLLARSALAALDADPQFRDVNLLVSVVDGVAVVGGSVPTREVGEQAGQTIRRNVAAIKDVKNLCFVHAGPDPLIRAMAGGTPAARRPAATSLPLPGVVTSPGGAKPDVVGFANDTALAAAVPGEQRVVAQRPANPGPSVLLPPVGLGGAARPAVPPAPSPVRFASVPPAPAVGTVPGRPADIQATADAVRRTDRRFAGLSVELRDGTLVIAGTAARPADAWDFAEQFRRVPGVARVAVDVR